MLTEFIKSKKKLIINIILTFMVLLVTAILAIFILSAFGILSYNKGIEFNPELFESFKNSWYGWFIFIAYQTILTMLLCVVPGASMAFIVLSTKIYGFSIEAFLVSFISVLISSTIMYLIGRKGGYKMCEKWLGKEDCEKSIKLLRSKSTIYFPLMMIFPVFPDDALVMIAGTMKMKLRYFIPSILLGRGFGVFTIVFGFSLIPFDKFTTPYDWIVFITVCLYWISVIFKLAEKINVKINKAEYNE